MSDEKDVQADGGSDDQPDSNNQSAKADVVSADSGSGNEVENKKAGQDNLWTVACHLAAFLGVLGAAKIPFGNVLGPLIVWLLKKNDMPEVDEHGKESLNFQISITIYMLVAIPFVFVLVGIPIIILLAIADIVLVIIAAIKASNGEKYKYPYTIRLIK